MRRKSRSLLLTVVVGVVSCGGASADDVGSDLIRRIKQTEDGLGNFDVVARVLKYSVDDANRMTDAKDIQCELQRYVVDGNRFFASRDFLVGSPGGATIRRHEKRGFDGKQSWSTGEQGNNNSPTTSDAWSVPRRHDLLVRQLFGDLSLTDALLLHDIQFENETSIDGIPCQVLLISQLSDRKVRVWIATTRNYIPLKAEAFVEEGGMRRNIDLGFVSDWREVAAGVWFPHYMQVITATGTVTETFVESLAVAPSGAENGVAIPNVEIQNEELDRIEPEEATGWLLAQPAWVWMFIINDTIIVALICYYIARLLVNHFRPRVASDRQP